jgi:hypothetical protein
MNQNLEKFAFELFEQASSQVVGLDLSMLKKTLLASQLMYFNDVLSTLGQSHVIVQKILQTAKTYNISQQMIQFWSAEIRIDWEQRNSEFELKDHNSTLFNLQALISDQHKMIMSQSMDLQACRSMIMEQQSSIEKLTQSIESMASSKADSLLFDIESTSEAVVLSNTS